RNRSSTTQFYTLSLHDALPIFHLIGNSQVEFDGNVMTVTAFGDKLENLHFVEDAIVNFYVKNTVTVGKIKDVEDILRDNKLLRRSEEHTSELQSRFDLVCRLLL